MMRMRSAWTAVALAGVIGIASQSHAAGVFQEQNGLVVCEIESEPLAGDWKRSTSQGGYTGSAYYWLDGNSYSTGSVNGILKYTINITHAGEYHFRLRCSKGYPADSTWSNDIYLKLVNGPSPVNNFIKVYGGSMKPNWGWAKTYDQNHNKWEVKWNLSAGQHEIQIAGRSKAFMIDRFVLYNTVYTSESAAKSTSNPESPTGGGGGGGSSTPTNITSPSAGADLTKGSTISLTGTGDGTLTWKYDANSDGQGEIQIGTGSPCSFTVPTNVNNPNDITITLYASGGTDSVECNLVGSGGTTPPPPPPPTTYTLTVNSGNGDGDYEAGTVVNINAASAPSGTEFDTWTGSVGNVANVNDPTTTITMPASDATVTATYRAVIVYVDSDDDGLWDYEEDGIYGTDPNDADTDGDGMSDGDEVSYGFDPLNSDEDDNGTLDGQDDWDDDGITNADEVLTGESAGLPYEIDTAVLSCTGGVGGGAMADLAIFILTLGACLAGRRRSL